MRKVIVLTLLFLNVSIIAANTQDSTSINLKVTVDSIVSSQGGEIGVAVFNKRKGYPIRIKHAYKRTWKEIKGDEGSIEFNFDSLLPGEYAVSVMHDANGNRKLDRTFIGFPKEGVGFSNDQKVVFSAPKFKKSKFSLSKEEHKEITIHLEYRGKKKRK